MTAALLFPGQGSQFVGMARDVYDALPAARDVIREADAILGFKLSNLMFEGPEDELTATDNAQPAIFTASIAMLRCIDLPAGVAFAAGHSVGEYSALVAAGAMAFADGLRLVRERGRLMHEAGTDTPGGMLAVLGVDDAAIEEACASVAPLVVCAANYNGPGQTIVSGEAQGLVAVTEALKARGAKRVLRLNVSAAFHSPVMARPAARLASAIDQVPVQAPRWAVIGNVSAQPLTSEPAIREELAAQIAAPVRWHASIQTMLDAGVTRFIEIGPGKVLSGLMKRIAPDALAESLCDLDSISAFRC
ncbi:MAG TPA: ACP S-malonyltransferase [Chloroflexota bacterium]|nr:ACP S-malonyltransferase [Chloroflexota bacterium]